MSRGKLQQREKRKKGKQKDEPNMDGPFKLEWSFQSSAKRPPNAGVAFWINPKIL